VRAQYLLRFDDLCPTMNWRIWDEVEEFLCEQRIHPILAVVPENQDETLRVSTGNADFWNRARAWQARGWTIGMHGWQHRFVTKDSGILRVNNYSEFAGLSECEQECKLAAGIKIFRGQGVKTQLWIAPAHSFDAVTLRLLPRFGLRFISDGFSTFPYVDESGIAWIPQQLWSFRRRPFGVWTICLHFNLWTETDLSAFKQAVSCFREEISSFAEISSRYKDRRKSLFDSVASQTYRSAAVFKSSIAASFMALRRPASLAQRGPSGQHAAGTNR